ncbi:hypothetical protein AJ80_08493 [Polytolypa hystricis UAMH7299]|uniref:Uncharacterized protein n=1 Tax=Polytolypa hystricis (strain UAMH7299) TaxID=1447883 RepID=A0A2B7X6X1_POLH7|nr:hypothetical protein AJ80_08493 [Polytolypa hystricis UAMH7299]
MSLDPGFPRSSSPASSDPPGPKRRSQAHDDGLKEDKSYRRYASTVERALSLFDTALQEWADYISFLSRLLKALQSHPPTLLVVPHKTIVAKRLAQCLNPSLPSGVHQKALEVYGYIFDLLKPEGLARDLALYLPGIAPTLTFASLTVRPLFLSLVETYLVDLDSAAIRPALKAIVLALLPGLEEETSEDFDTTLGIVNKFRNLSFDAGQQVAYQGDDDTGGQYFWQCLFLASITNPSRRMGALAYLNRYLPKLGGTEPWSLMSKEIGDENPSFLPSAADSVTKPEPGLLIRCFATGLADEQLLVQRNFLDLLVTHLPLHSPVLQKSIAADDLSILISAAAGVVTRRDMSLNRRLWSWFLGPETSSNEHEPGDADLSSVSSPNAARIALDSETLKSQYFARFGLKPLVQSLTKMIGRNSLHPPERAKPFRISLSLMDRWEVGGLVVPAVFLPIMRSVKQYKRLATSNTQFDEVFRSASAFFDGVESSLIFSELLSLLHPDSSSINTRSERAVDDLKLARFIASSFNMTEEEMLIVHIPLLLLVLLIKIMAISSALAKEPEFTNIQVAALDKASSVANILLDLIPDRALLSKNLSAASRITLSEDREDRGQEILQRTMNFYKRSRESLDLPALPFSSEQMGELLILEAQSLVLSSLERDEEHCYLSERVIFFISLLGKVPKSEMLRSGGLFQAMYEKFHSLLQSPTVDLGFGTVYSITSLVTTLFSIHSTGFYLTYTQVHDLVPLLVRMLWRYLSPASPKFHVEAVRCLLLLHSVTWQDHLVEASISSIMIKQAAPFTSSHITTTDHAESFFVLWNLSNNSNIEPATMRAIKGRSSSGHVLGDLKSAMLERPLFITLDLLSGTSNRDSSIVKEWLHDLPSVHKIFHTILLRLGDLAFLWPENKGNNADHAPSAESHGTSQCSYLLQTLSHAISTLSPAGWSSLNANVIPEFAIHMRQKGADDQAEPINIQDSIMLVCIRAMEVRKAALGSRGEVDMEQSALSVMRQLLSGPSAAHFVHLDVDTFLMDRLSLALDRNENALQPAMIDALLVALKNRFTNEMMHMATVAPRSQRKSSLEALSNLSRLSLTSDKPEELQALHAPQPPHQLLPCLLKGINSASSHATIEKWVVLLSDCLPLYSGTIFQILLTLVESFCKRINESYSNLQTVFQKTDHSPQALSERFTIALLTGLETCIATAHDRLLAEEANIPVTKSPDPPQGFFGNMVSGVFTSETAQTRGVTANNRLTVLLCFQDAVRLCFSIWTWGSTGRNGSSQDPECTASFQYSSLRMRNRSRRILEHLFTAEALDCLETLVQLWRASVSEGDPTEARLVFSLLHTLDGSRPKITIPAIFNAIYSRTNPAALEPSRKSAMTARLSEADLVAFLVTYARSLDNDVLDEIWVDCTTFLRDVLANPFPHRQILPRLIEFAAILGEKMEHTTFGDDRRARKDLGDLLLRLLTAIFTSKPLGSSQELSVDSDRSGAQQAVGPDDIISILGSTMPSLMTTLGESDRILTAMSGISTNIVGPLFHSRLFPANVNKGVLGLVHQMSKVPSASKLWRKDVADAFNDPKFFSTKLGLVQSSWLGLLRQWVLTDKDRLPELLSRLTTPTSAGIMFGVGATAARLEADRKAQLNLRRIALLVLAANEDHFSSELPNLHQKLEDLLAATHISSPSSATRAEIYMVLRSLVLNTSTIHLAPFWPTINNELHDAISAISPSQSSEAYNPYSLLQACKLLETLLLIAPDDFQLQEWLFVTDTVDIIYPPDRWESIALADEVAQDLGTTSSSTSRERTTSAQWHDPSEFSSSSSSSDGVKKSWLNSELSRETAKDEIVDRVLRPFFDHLSIHAFESTYGLGTTDRGACREDLMADLFNEFTMAN